MSILLLGEFDDDGEKDEFEIEAEVTQSVDDLFDRLYDDLEERDYNNYPLAENEEREVEYSLDDEPIVQEPSYEQRHYFEE